MVHGRMAGHSAVTTGGSESAEIAEWTVGLVCDSVWRPGGETPILVEFQSRGLRSFSSIRFGRAVGSRGIPLRQQIPISLAAYRGGISSKITDRVV